MFIAEMVIAVRLDVIMDYTWVLRPWTIFNCETFCTGASYMFNVAFQDRTWKTSKWMDWMDKVWSNVEAWYDKMIFSICRTIEL